MGVSCLRDGVEFFGVELFGSLIFILVIFILTDLNYNHFICINAINYELTSQGF